VSDLEGKLVRALGPRAEVLEAYLFGSQALGRAQPHSDIDVAVYIQEAKTTASVYGYAADLTTDLMAALATNAIDVVVLNYAPPVLYHRVLRDGRRILSRDLRATTTREGYALSRYCDFVPQLRKMEAAMAGARKA
jgi:predicted nucleotidyltransferase